MSIAYGGGPLLTAPITIYPVYYGSWAASDPRTSLVAALLAGVTSTNLWRVVTGYTDARGAPATASVSVAAAAFVGAPYGLDWGSTDHTAAVARRALDVAGALGNPNSVALVLASHDVRVPGWGDTYCAYHSWFGNQAYMFAGDSPNQDCAFAGNQLLPMAAGLLHELEEVVTDPYGNAWQSSDKEVGDLCDWQLEPLPGAPDGYYTADQGVRWNLNVSGHLFLVQSVWDQRKRHCSMGVGAPARPPQPPAKPPPAGPPAPDQPPEPPLAPPDQPPAPAPSSPTGAGLTATVLSSFFLIAMSSSAGIASTYIRAEEGDDDFHIPETQLNPMAWAGTA